MNAFVQDWTVRPQVATEWQTDVVAAAETLSEERRALAPRPRRTIFVRWTGIERAEANRLLFTIARACDEPLEVPLYPDVAVVTSSSSGTTINCPTTNRRFAVGGRVLVHGARGADAQVRTIAAIAADSIEVTAALTGTVPVGAVAYPALQVRVALEGRLLPRTDGVCDVAAAFVEDLETSLPGSCAYADLAADHAFGVADDGDGNEYFVLDVDPDWRVEPTIDVARSGRQERMGREDVVFTRGPRPLFTFELAVAALDRAAHARTLAFFDAHRGREKAFFMRNPLTLWEATAIATTYVEVDPVGDLDDVQDFASWLVVEAAGAIYVRPITAVALQGDAWRFSLGVNLPVLSLGDITRVTLGHLVRFSEDALLEEWITNTAAALRLRMVELVDERTDGLDDSWFEDLPCEEAPP